MSCTSPTHRPHILQLRGHARKALVHIFSSNWPCIFRNTKSPVAQNTSQCRSYATQSAKLKTQWVKHNCIPGPLESTGPVTDQNKKSHSLFKISFFLLERTAANSHHSEMQEYHKIFRLCENLQAATGALLVRTPQPLKQRRTVKVRPLRFPQMESPLYGKYDFTGSEHFQRGKLL